MKTRGRFAAFAAASARWPVPCVRLSRMRCFLASVQRPDDGLSRQVNHGVKARNHVWRKEGAMGPRQSDLVPVAWPRTRQVTADPPAFKEGKSADPIGPEAPLTRTRIRLQL